MFATTEIITIEKAQEVLLNSLKLIKKDGWCQQLMHSEGKHCLIGAIASSAKDYNIEIRMRACEAIRRVIMNKKDGSSNIADWNDMPSRKSGEVTEVIEEAIQNLAKERNWKG